MPVRPRQRFPAPITIATSTFSWRTSEMIFATNSACSGWIPNPSAPPSVSPLSLSRTRLYFKVRSIKASQVQPLVRIVKYILIKKPTRRLAILVMIAPLRPLPIGQIAGRQCSPQWRIYVGCADPLGSCFRRGRKFGAGDNFHCNTSPFYHLRSVESHFQASLLPGRGFELSHAPVPLHQQGYPQHERTWGHRLQPAMPPRARTCEITPNAHKNPFRNSLQPLHLHAHYHER